MSWNGSRCRRDEPRPAIILLDLNMPRKGGYAALEEMKAQPEIRGGLVEAMKCFGEYWTELATLPGTLQS